MKLSPEIIEKQREYEYNHNKNLLSKRLAEEFKEVTEDPLEIFILVQLYLHKRMEPKALIGACRNRCETLSIASKTISAMLSRGDIEMDSLGRLVSVYDLDEEVKKEIDKYQFPPPLLIPPRKLRKNTSSAYWFNKRDSVILKNNHTEDDVCLDVLNRANSIPLTLNQKVMTMTSNKWRNLEHQKPDETEAEFIQRKKAFDLFEERAKEVREWIVSHENRFWLSHKEDKRGRMYSVGYQINDQGTDYQKAVVEFFDKEHVHAD